MKKQEINKDIVTQVLICKNIFDRNDDVRYYFEYNADEKWSYSINQYIYKFEMESMRRGTSIFRIIDIMNEDEQVRDNIIKLKDNEYIRPIYSGYRWNVPDSVLRDMLNYSLSKLQKEITNMFKGLKCSLFLAKLEAIDEGRKKFLLDTFGTEDSEEFEKGSLRSKIKWFKEFNAYDINFQFVISLYELKPALLELISKNEQICNIDKIALQAKYEEEIEDLVESIFLRENARTQMDSYIGVDFCDETKELVWGYMSPCEIKVEFCFFWMLIKSMLSLAYIPTVILLLQDKDAKIYMYIFLALVYLIAIIFSDERQVEKLLIWKNSIGKKQVGYVSLYYLGLIVSTTFIIFSIQLAQGLIERLLDIIIYLFADIMFAYVTIHVFNLCISLVAWGATLLVSIRGIRKKGKRIYNVMKRLIKTLFWIYSFLCCFYVLNIQKYFRVGAEDDLGADIFVFMFCFMIAEINILTIWKKETDTGKSINCEER